jgi:hypothetical protein
MLCERYLSSESRIVHRRDAESAEVINLFLRVLCASAVKYPKISSHHRDTEFAEFETFLDQESFLCVLSASAVRYQILHSVNPKSKIENPKYVHAFFLDLGPNGSG